MELQKALPQLEQAGYTVFGVSYDGVDALAAFAQQRGITFPLLSDEGSAALRSLGLLNEHLEQQHAHYGVATRPDQLGVAYPGTFRLDRDGVVVEKTFEQGYRPRPTAAVLLEDLAQADPASLVGVADEAQADGVAVRAWLAEATYRPYQQLRLHLDVQVAPGLHVYGEPVPDGYTPLSVAIDPQPDLVVEHPSIPAPRSFRVEGLDEDFVVHQGRVPIAVPLSVQGRAEAVTLTVHVRFQACTESVCYPPSELTLTLPLTGLGAIRD